ncbi:MAG: hypothetical protein HQK76_17275 [Desulfobacterales bacterium]|nr:hypothetical protein [Desulfobacterales bacterium]
MKKYILILFLSINFIFGEAIAAHISDFELKGNINCSQFQLPVRLHIFQDIISNTSKDMRDIRIFDDKGTEIPYIIYTEFPPASTMQRFQWKIVSYDNDNGVQAFILEIPRGQEIFNKIYDELIISTHARDFKKNIEIFFSDDSINWEKKASGVIFDFSSQVDLRDTKIKIPGTSSKYLKVLMKDDNNQYNNNENVTLTYKDLFFSLKTQIRGAIKINYFESFLSRESSDLKRYDSFTISNPESFVDKDGNTIVKLGCINLPAEKISLRLKNLYYYREVQLWTADKDKEDDKSSKFLGKGYIYKIPSIEKENKSIDFNGSKQRCFKLKIINGDNPQVSIEEVKIEWTKRNLYFIPENGREYRMFFKGKNLALPKYELGLIIPYNYDELMRYSECSITEITKNEEYNPKTDPNLKAKFERYLFISVMLVLVCLLAFWIFTLIKKINPEDLDK